MNDILLGISAMNDSLTGLLQAVPSDWWSRFEAAFLSAATFGILSPEGSKLIINAVKDYAHNANQDRMLKMVQANNAEAVAFLGGLSGQYGGAGVPQPIFPAATPNPVYGPAPGDDPYYPAAPGALPDIPGPGRYIPGVY